MGRGFSRRHRPAITSPRPDITGPRLDITPHTSPGTAAVTGELTAGERLAAPAALPRWRPRTRKLAWAAAIALHVLVFLLFCLVVREHLPRESQSPPGISVVFQHGGTQQTAAPLTPQHGPESPAQAPRPAPPPPPPQTAQAQPEVNLNMPQLPQARRQSAPHPQPRPQPRPQPHPVAQPSPPQKYVVMNNMSYGNPAPPLPNAQRALNLSLAQSDAQAVNAPELTIKGDIGADWDAELSKWVNEHKYYPEAAVEQDQQGNVEIEFTVDRAGRVTGLHLLSGSGSPFLDQAWLGLFDGHHLPPFPPGTKAGHITVDATMHFELIP